MNLSKSNNNCPAQFTLGSSNATPKGSLGLKFREELLQLVVERKGKSS